MSRLPRRRLLRQGWSHVFREVTVRTSTTWYNHSVSLLLSLKSTKDPLLFHLLLQNERHALQEFRRRPVLIDDVSSSIETKLKNKICKIAGDAYLGIKRSLLLLEALFDEVLSVALLEVWESLPKGLGELLFIEDRAMSQLDKTLNDILNLKLNRLNFLNLCN